MGRPLCLSSKESTCQWRRPRRCGLDPWVRKIPCRRKWQPTPVHAWGIPWTEECFVLRSMGSHRVGDSWSRWAHSTAKAGEEMSDVLWKTDARSPQGNEEQDLHYIQEEAALPGFQTTRLTSDFWPLLLSFIELPSRVGFFVTMLPWTLVSQAPLSTGFSRQEYQVAISFSRGSSWPVKEHIFVFFKLLNLRNPL